MSQSQSAYNAFAELLAASGQSVSPAELQGLLLGRCCAGAGFSGDGWLAEAGDLFAGEVPSNLHAALLGLQEMVKAELQAKSSVALTLLLPGDEDPLSVRTIAMGQWAQGFISGFGANIGTTKLSDDIQETIEDLINIAKIEPEAEDDEEGEVAYMEINEYLRAIPLFLFTACTQQPAADNAEQDTPAVH